MKKTKTAGFAETITAEGMASKDAAIVLLELEFDTGDVLTASGTAKRSSGDKFTKGVGEMLAMSRALESMARKLRKHINGYL